MLRPKYEVRIEQLNLQIIFLFAQCVMASEFEHIL